MYCTPLEATLTLLGQLSPYSEHLYCPASAKETEWIEHPATATALASLLPDYSLYHPSLFVYDLELLALLAMGVQCCVSDFCHICDAQAS